MKVGIVGASGAVGEELVKVIAERQLALGGVEAVKLFASKKSAGRKVESAFGQLEIEEFELGKMEGLDYVFLAVSGDFATEYARQIIARGPIVIDNSSAFRYDADVPLVIPEINMYAAKGAKLVANPNCTTAVAAMALWPIYQRFGLSRVIMSTYQASSGAGAEGMAELEAQAHSFAQGKTLENTAFSYPLLFNVIPHIDAFQPNGYTREEMKVVWETRKIFGDDRIDVSCTCVRIPTLRAHAEAISIETFGKVTPEQAREVIKAAPGVELVDDPAAKKYPMPLNASAKNDVEAGRIRQSLVFGERGLDLFVCGDQLLRGAALNAVLIAEFMHKGEFEEPKRPRRVFAPTKDTLAVAAVVGASMAFGAALAIALGRRN